MTTTSPPIVVIEGGDIMFFTSLDAVTAYIEPVDVAAGIYQFYDATGLRLDASVEGSPGLGTIKIGVAAGDAKPEELVSALGALLRCSGIDIPPHATLSDLVSLASPLCKLL